MTDENADTMPEPVTDAAGSRATEESPAPRDGSRSPPSDQPKPAPAAPSRRTSSVVALLLALVALAGAAFAVYQLENGRRSLDAVRAEFSEALQADATALAELRRNVEEFGQRQDEQRRDVLEQIDELRDLPRELATVRAGLGDVRTALAEMRNRSEQPSRAWSRAEARALLDLAAHRLRLERDVATALDALTTADALLADLDDPAFEPVLDLIARDLRELEAVPQPDRVALAARLIDAEQRIGSLPLAGTVLDAASGAAAPALPEGGLERAWALVRNAFANLVSVRRLGDADAIVNADLAALRRQHLEVLLLSAGTALLRADASTFAMAVTRAQAWIERYFLTEDPRVVALLDELRALEQVDVAPPLPDLSASVRALDAVPTAAGGAP